MYFVAEGSYCLTTSTAEGKQAMLTFIQAPQWVGETALFDHTPRLYDGRADSDGWMLHLRRADLVALLDGQPQHWKAFGQLMAQKLRLALLAIDDAALGAPTSRVARRLLAIADAYGESNGSSHRVVRARQEQLGSMLSLSRQTVNRILGDLKAKGCLRLARGAIEILDRDELLLTADLKQLLASAGSSASNSIKPASTNQRA